jgi:hypothetical protein
MPRENFKKQSVGHKIVGKKKGIHIPIYVVKGRVVPWTERQHYRLEIRVRDRT